MADNDGYIDILERRYVGTTVTHPRVDLAKPNKAKMVRTDGVWVDDDGVPYLRVFYDPDATFVPFKKKTGGVGYVRKSDFDALNVSTVTIPANFAGLEAEAVPPRLQRQLFRIVEVVENEDYVEVTARHVWYDNLKNYCTWKPTAETEYTAAAVCRNVLTNTISPVSSRVASDCQDTKKGDQLDFQNKNLVECFLDPEKGICAQFGLSLIRYNWDFYCLKEVGYDRGFVVENGKNMLGVERTESIENLVTRVAPIGKDSKGDIVWLDYQGKKYIDSQYINDYSCPHVELLDTGLTVGKDGVTAANIQEKLLEAAQKRFADDHVDIPEVEMTVEFLSLGDTEEYSQYRGLDKVYLYDIIHVHDTVRGYDYSAQVIEVEHDVLTGMLLSVTIGKLDAWDGTRKIATWQVPEVNGENIRLKSILAGAFAPGAIGADDLREAIISYAHFASATIDRLEADSIEAVTAHIHEIIAGSITAEDIQAGSITTELLAAGSITTEKLEANAVTAGKIAAGAVTTEKLDAYAVTASKLAAGAVEADKIAAGAINADKIDANSVSAINAKLGTAEVASAVIAEADINFAHIKDLNAESAFFGQTIFNEAVGGKLYVPRLSVGYAQMIGATISDLVIQASDEKYYKLDVAMNGDVTATEVTPSQEEIEQGHTDDGRTIYIGTDILATDLNTENIYAGHALMDEITAAILNVDQLFAREATIGKINALDLSSNTYIQATIGNWQSGSTITQTLNSISTRISELGYGTIYYSETEPDHNGLVQGDLWVQPLDSHTWGEALDSTWGYAVDNDLTWGDALGNYKIYTWTGEYFKLMYNSTIAADLQTQIDQNAYAITLKANQSEVDVLSDDVSDFAATLEIQAQEIQTAVAAVNQKTATYVMWTDPRDAYPITLGDIWIKQAPVTTWGQAAERTWGDALEYSWKDPLGGETYVWDGLQWVMTSDRGSEVAQQIEIISQQTQIDQTLTSISLMANSIAKINGDLYTVSAALVVANDRITSEVQRATTAEGGKLDKTSQYQTADSIVTSVESWVAVNLADKSWIEQTATGIGAYVAEYVGENAYKIRSGIDIKAAGIEIGGAKYILIKSGGTFQVESGNFAVNSSGDVTLTGTIHAASGDVGGWSLTGNRLSSGTGAGYVALDSDPSGTYAIWAGNATAANAAFWVKRNGEAKFAGAISSTSGSIGGWTLASNNMHSGAGTNYIAMASSGNYMMWAGAENSAAAPFRLKADGTVYLTKLIAVGETGTETEVNLRTAGLWKLNYQTIKSLTVSDGYCTSITFSGQVSGTQTVNFRRAAAVSLTGRWSGRTFTVTETSSGQTYSETPTYSSGAGYGTVDSITVNSFSALHFAYARVLQSSQQGGNVLFGFKIDATGEYNGGYNQAIDDATQVTRYTRTATPYGGGTTHYYKDGNNYVSCGSGWYQTTLDNECYHLPAPKQ